MPISESRRPAPPLVGLESLRAYTVNHRTHGFDGLSRVSVDASSAAEIHATLAVRGVESVFLCTCNRRELYWHSRNGSDDSIVLETLVAAMRPDTDVLTRSTLLTGAAVADHLFRVCAGLESAVLGEAEILGQVRAALGASPTAGTFLTGVLRSALRAGGMARAETAIGEGALSVASTAIQWLSRQMPLADQRVLVLGAGSTGRKVARHLRALGVGRLVIANRTRSHAEELGASVNADGIDLTQLQRELTRADVVISAVTTREWLITRDQLAGRGSTTPLTVIDLSMPPSIEPGEVDGVRRVDLTLLDQTAELNRTKRKEEIPQVETVIAREIEWLNRWALRESTRPLLAARYQEKDAPRRTESFSAGIEQPA